MAMADVFFSRSRAQEQRKDPVAQSLFREAGQPPWQWEPTTVDAVSTSCGCRVNEWFNCSTPLYPSQSVRKKGMPQKLGEKTPGSQGLGAAAKFDSYLLDGTLLNSWFLLVSGSKKADGKPPEIHTCAPCLGERRPTLLCRWNGWVDLFYLEDHSRDLDTWINQTNYN